MSLFKGMKYCLFTFLILIPVLSFGSESFDSTLFITSIEVKGNERTKKFVILRELDFKAGDTLSYNSLEKVVKENENQIFNTGLFLSVNIEFNRMPGNVAGVVIYVKERWYTFPYPILELADRNFNEWWVQRGHDLRRLNYGVRFIQENVRGRNEELKLVAQGGFTKKFEGFYTIPFINGKKTLGVRFGGSYSSNKQVAHSAPENRLIYTEGNGVIRERIYGIGEIFHRREVHKTHTLSLRYNDNWIDDTVLAFNNKYFLKGVNDQNFFQLSYSFENDNRDLANYPLEGFYLLGTFTKLGLGTFEHIDVLFSEGIFSGYLKLSKRWFFSTEFRGKYSFYGKQPFFNIQALGYKQTFVRGYEYFVINGQHYALQKNSLKFFLFEKQLKFLDFIPVEKFRKVPFAVYLKVFADQGYVVDDQFLEQNPLANEYLRGVGVGLDMVTYYDMVGRVEVTMNKSKNIGFFLHFEKAL